MFTIRQGLILTLGRGAKRDDRLAVADFRRLLALVPREAEAREHVPDRSRRDLGRQSGLRRLGASGLLTGGAISDRRMPAALSATGGLRGVVGTVASFAPSGAWSG